jgi:hypothetical protein
MTPNKSLSSHWSKPRIDTSEIGGFKIDGVYCKLIALTQGQFAIVWESDYEWINQWIWYAQRTKEGTKHYAVRVGKDANGRTIKLKMHRVILGLDHHDPRIGDHIRPADTLRNTRDNLRIANHSESQCNRRKPKHNTSGFKGVRWNKRKLKYQADIWVGKKHYNLGYSDTPEGASKKYEAGILKHHGKFGQVN